MLKQLWMGTLAGIAYRLYSATWTYHVDFADGSTPFDLTAKRPARSLVVGHWHGDELALIGIGRQYQGLTMASQSKDGAIMAAALKVMGFTVARGSSSRGGLRGFVVMLRMLRNDNYLVTFAVDGPNGPRHMAKPGVHRLALKADLPLYQCVVKCDRKWTLHKTWNQTYVPKPFAHICLRLYELPKPTQTNSDDILARFNARRSYPE